MLRYLFITLLVCSTFSAFASKTVSREIYENAIDHLNCELAKFYIKRNQGVYELEAYSDSLTDFGCNFEHLMVFIKERQPQMDPNGYLAEYVEALKSEFDSLRTNSALYNKAVNVFKEDLLNQYDGNFEYDELKSHLKDFLEEELKIHEVGTGDGVENTKEPSESFLNRFTDLGWQFYLFVFFGIIFIYAIYRLFSWANKYFSTGTETSSMSEMERKAAAKTKEITENSEKRERAKAVEKEILDEEEEEDDEEEVSKSKSVVKPVKAPVKEEKKIKIQPPEPVEEIPSEEVFYMAYPSVDGSFYEAERLEKYEFGETAFKFQIKIVEYGLATFEVISDTNIITDIFMDYERTIKAVCEIEGKPKDLSKVIRPGIKRIITVKPGTVQKRTQHQHWRLRQKAIIRFEYV